MSTRTYNDAVNHLNSLQSNAATLEAVRASGGRLSRFAIPEMLEYLERIGYSVCVQESILSEFRHGLLCPYRQPEDLNKLNVAHITGTKGKGSTSAFTDSILRHAMPQWKIGTQKEMLNQEFTLIQGYGQDYTRPPTWWPCASVSVLTGFPYPRKSLLGFSLKSGID